jgi:hypothetical protein
MAADAAPPAEAKQGVFDAAHSMDTKAPTKQGLAHGEALLPYV